MKKSLTINAVMSGLKTILQILFPLITFPYISNVLQVENLGKVNFANSVCGYFLLFAGLGIRPMQCGGLQVCERPRKALGFFIGDVLHQYGVYGPFLFGAGCGDPLLGKAAGIHGTASHYEFADLFHDDWHGMDLYNF